MDKFNDIWKNRFNEGDAPKASWNNPSEDIWANILTEIPQEKPNRKGLLWILSTSIVLLISFIGYKSCSNTNTYSQATPIHTSQQFNSTISKVESTQREDQSISQDETNTTKSKKAIVKSLPLSKLNNSSSDQIYVENKNPKKIYISTDVIEQKDNVRFLNSNDIIPKVIDEHTTLKSSGTPSLKSNQYSNISKLKSIGIQTIDDQTANPYLKLSDIKPINTNTRLSIGVSSGLVYWQHQISNEYLSALDPFEFNYQDNIGFNVQLGFNYRLNKRMQLSSGLSYDRVAIKSGHNSNLQYQLQEEFENSQNKYFLALATPYGFVDSEFDVKRVENITDENINLNASVHSTQIIHNISIPVSLGIKLLTFKRFNVEASTGLGINYLAQIENKLDNVNPNHSAFQYDENNTKLGAVDINHWHMDYRIGMLMTYNINPNTTLNLHYNYVKGLNAIYKTSDFDTKINRHYFSFSLIKAL